MCPPLSRCPAWVRDKHEESVRRHRVFFPPGTSSSVPFASEKVPQATDRNSKHPYIGWSHLLTSLPISSVSPFVYNSSRAHSHPPSLRPALLLLALGVVVLGVSSLLSIKTWQRLPVFVHTPTEASLSAFGWTALKVKEGTRWREGREVRGGGGEGGAAKCANPDEYAALWVTSHFTQWSRTAIVKRH